MITRQPLRTFLLSFTVIIFVSGMPLYGLSQAPVCSDLLVDHKSFDRPLEVGGFKGLNRTWVYLTDPISKERVASLDFHYEPPTLEIGFMNVKDIYRQTGLGTVLMQLALNQHPETEVILIKRLVDDNEAILVEALKEGITLEEAIKRTPSYKIHSKLGFAEIVPNSILSKKEGYGFAVRRSHSETPILSSPTRK